MAELEEVHDRLLIEARQRGRDVLGTAVLPPGTEHIAAYIGLISNALELGKLLATEQRDLEVIGSHHEIEIAKIGVAFKETEAAMRADFERDTALREQAFLAINSLIAAGQYEVATKFYEILMGGFRRPALETIMENRNAIAANTKTRMTLK